MQQLLEIMESAPKNSSLPLLSPNDAARRINYLELEARNQQLGDEGEKLVMASESPLTNDSRIDLLDLEQVSETLGPMLATTYALLSGMVRNVSSMKTTKYGKLTPFFVTANELLFLRNREQYHLSSL